MFDYIIGFFKSQHIEIKCKEIVTELKYTPLARVMGDRARIGGCGDFGGEKAVWVNKNKGCVGNFVPVPPLWIIPLQFYTLVRVYFLFPRCQC